MKTAMKTMVFLLFILINPLMSVNAQNKSETPVTYQTFYDELSPYGTWMEYPSIGYVWHPDVENDFRPYLTNGNWQFMEQGWFWSSNYDWGWAPFHYGRWFYDNNYGWLWSPGYDWAPAWVTWATVNDYYAWAPLTPKVDAGRSFTGWKPHDFYWNIAHPQDICHKNIAEKVIPARDIQDEMQMVYILDNFDVTVNGHFYAKGPNPYVIAKFSNRNISNLPLRDVYQVARNLNIEPDYIQPVTGRRAQPFEYKGIDVNQVSPISNISEWPSNNRKTQIENIDNLPVKSSFSFK